MNEMFTQNQKLNLFSKIAKHFRVCGLVMLLLMSSLSWQVAAQVPIGEQSSTTSTMPINGLYDYSYSQQIVYQNEINANGDITSISFYFVSGINTDRNDDWTIHMGHTAKTDFTSNTDWISSGSLSQVFTGDVTFPEPNNWMTVTFDDPFTYNGTDNLVVAVRENKPNYASTSYGRTPDIANSNRSIYTSRDNTPIDLNDLPSGKSRYNHINNMILGGIQQSCPFPNELVVTALGETTATLEWTENGSATDWELIYGPTGFNPLAGGTSVNASTNPSISLIELDGNSGYDFYVKAVCALDDESSLNGPESFHTTCAASSVPFIEGFESGNTHDTKLENCWSQESIAGTTDWTVNSTLTTYNRTPRTGNFNVTLKYGNTDWIFYPVALTEGTPYQLKFYARQDGANATNASVQASFGIANSAAAMTNSIVASTPLVNGDYQEMAGYFTPPSSGVYYIGIKGTINGSPWYISLDDISVEEAAGCLEPSGLMASNISSSSADLSWTPINSETQWEVIYGVPGFNPELDGTTVSASNDPEITLSDLSENTSYDYYVTAICGVGDESDLVGPESFRTTCNSTTVPYLLDFETATIPNLPPCTSREKTGSGNDWVTGTRNSGEMSGNVLRYGYNSFAANAWFYTQGIEMEAGIDYQISYDYFGSSSWPEKMKVAYGTAPEFGAMATVLADHPSIGADGAETVIFTPAVDDVYYFGFNVYSIGGQNLEIVFF